MPFSGIIQENGEWKGTGYAFYILDLLSDKLNFTYIIVPPKEQILGNKYQGIVNMLYEKVQILFCAKRKKKQINT